MVTNDFSCQLGKVKIVFGKHFKISCISSKYRKLENVESCCGNNITCMEHGSINVAGYDYVSTKLVNTTLTLVEVNILLIA